jgi:hypothetical protein
VQTEASPEQASASSASPPTPSVPSSPSPSAASPPPSSRKKQAGKLGNLASLQAVKDAARQAAEEKKAREALENQQNGGKEISYELDDQINIDEARFKEALASLVNLLKKENKHNLANILETCQYELQHNRWLLKVQAVGISLIEKNQEILPYMRKALAVPQLFWEVELAETYVNPSDTRPYTEEEKLKEMEKKNPALLNLQKRFKTRIIYR